MTKETIGIIAGSIIFLNNIPYIIRVWQKKIEINITGWSLWSVINVAMVLTYATSSGMSNIWAPMSTVISGFACTIGGMVMKEKWEKLEKIEWISIICCIASLILWFIFRNDKILSSYALYLSILADACASVLTIRFDWKHPFKDRPIPWVILGIASAISMFALPDNSLASYALPIYFTLVAIIISTPLVIVRILLKTPIREWI